MKIIILLSLVLIFAACGPQDMVTVEVCAVSYLLPTAWCLVHTLRKFKKGGEPKVPCNVHHEPTVLVCDETGKRAVANCPAHDVPESETPAFYCRRHACNALASPWFVLAWLDLQSKVQRYTDAELDAFARRVGEAGVRYIRIFYPGWNDYHPDGCVFPYEQEADSRWSLDRPNPVYDANLRRLAVALGRYEIGLYVDMADNCGEGEYWGFWKFNVNGIRGCYDESVLALAYWKAAVDRVLPAIGGAEGNIIGLGNELRRPDDNDVTLEWALAWAKPRVDYLIGLGVQKPITFSGGGRTAHKIVGATSDEDGNYPDNSYLAIIEHGIALVDHTPPGSASLEAWLAGYSKFHLLGLSDDGGTTQNWNQIPPEKRGTCSGDCCQASVAEKVKLIRLFSQYFTEGQFRVLEFLPREISWNEHISALADESLEPYWRIGIEVFGIDPRRTF